MHIEACGKDEQMATWICQGCGVQHADTAEPPDVCAICEDEREGVPDSGQQWTTMADLERTHRTEIREEEPGLHGIGMDPSFGIGQRGLLIVTPRGNVLWDCTSLLDQPASSRITELGGLSAICMSHPHFYGAHVDFADAFDARILLPVADREWIQRPSSRIELFTDRAEPLPGLAVIRIGGHFDGASVLHWPSGADGHGALLTGDTITVGQDRSWVSFMWSYPNYIPLNGRCITAIAERAGALEFDRIYGGWWGHVVVHDGPAAIRRSAERYLSHLNGEHTRD